MVNWDTKWGTASGQRVTLIKCPTCGEWTDELRITGTAGGSVEQNTSAGRTATEAEGGEQAATPPGHGVPVTSEPPGTDIETAGEWIVGAIEYGGWRFDYYSKYTEARRRYDEYRKVWPDRNTILALIYAKAR